MDKRRFPECGVIEQRQHGLAPVRAVRLDDKPGHERNESIGDIIRPQRDGAHQRQGLSGGKAPRGGEHLAANFSVGFGRGGGDHLRRQGYGQETFIAEQPNRPRAHHRRRMIQNFRGERLIQAAHLMERPQGFQRGMSATLFQLRQQQRHGGRITVLTEQTHRRLPMPLIGV